MRKILPLALVALAFATVACSKEPTPADKVNEAGKAATEKAVDATKKVDETLKK